MYDRGMNNFFHRFTHRVSEAVGSPYGFCLALLAVIVWACLGPAFGYSSEWQLVINTGTTIVTFLLVFIIQHTQNRDTKATKLMLSELINAIKEAKNEMIDLDDLNDAQLKRLEEQYKKTAHASVAQ